MKIEKKNIGVSWERVDFELPDGRPNPEKMFQELWNEENSSERHRGLGIAQSLFIVSKKSAGMFDGPDRDDSLGYDLWSGDSICVYDLTEREYRILATIIQWLGTNVGFGFLHEALRRSGYYIASKDSFPVPSLKKRKDRYAMLKEVKYVGNKQRSLERD